MKCSFCEAVAVFHNKPKRESFCKTHFFESVENRVFGTIREFKMVRPGDRVLVSFSGGKDSCVALFLLKKLLGSRKDFKLAALLINEGIAGYREKSIPLAEEFCRSLSVPFYVAEIKKAFGKSVDEISHSLDTLSACVFCGELREHLGFVLSESMNANKLVLCFNQMDYAQHLLGFYSFDDINRLASMNPIFPPDGLAPVQRILPLCRISQKEVALYAYLKKFRIDTGDCPTQLKLRKSGDSFHEDSLAMLTAFEAKHGLKSGLIHTFESCVSPALTAKFLSEKNPERRCQACGGFFTPPEKYLFSPGILCGSCKDSVGIKETFE